MGSLFMVFNECLLFYMFNFLSIPRYYHQHVLTACQCDVWQKQNKTFPVMAYQNCLMKCFKNDWNQFKGNFIVVK